MCYKKRIPTEGDFMKKKTNDILYGYLQYISYVDKNDKTFVYKNEVNFAKIANALGENYNPRKISRDFKFLENIGLVELNNVTTIDDEIIEAYVLPKIGDSYKLIPIETLKYLTHTANSNVIKIYVYLLYKYNNGQRKGYRFSKKELLSVLKLKSSTHMNHYTMIDNILTCLLNSELIKFDCVWSKSENSSIGATQYHILNEVSLTHKNPLKKKNK